MRTCQYRMRKYPKFEKSMLKVKNACEKGACVQAKKNKLATDLGYC